MSLSEIELFLYGGPCGHFVTAFRSREREVILELKPIEEDRSDSATKVIASFADATTPTMEQIDPNETWEYPLDPVGFDSCRVGGRWRFVLDCGSIEWEWESLWPTLEFEKGSDTRSIFNLGSSSGSNIRKDKDRMICEAVDAAHRLRRS